MLTSTAVVFSSAFAMAAAAASFTALDVRVAPETESQLLTVSAVASLPSSNVLIPFDLL